MNKNSRDRRLQRLYNITAAEWDQILAYQGGLCAICGRPAAAFKHLFVDHDHDPKNRVVRGLLCYRDNQLLPERKDLINLLQRAIEYLTHPPAVAALGEERLAAPLKRRRKK